MSPRRLFFLFIVSLSTATVWTQPREVHFHHLGESDGLSNQHIGAMVQDQQGYLWIATRYGLNRFDGHHFRVFKQNTADPHSLPENYLLTLLDDDDTLWVGTHGKGLAAFDKATERFTHHPIIPDSDVIVMALARTDDQGPWVATRYHGLVRLDPQTGELRNFRHDPLNPGRGPQTDELLHLGADTKGRLWLSTMDGLEQFNPQTQRFTALRPTITEGPNAGAPLFNRVYCTAPDTDDKLWIAANTGLYLYHQGAFERFLDQRVTFVATAADGDVWCGTRNDGLISVNPKTRAARRFRHDPLNRDSLIDNSIADISRDREGRLWFATSQGISRLDPNQPFEHFRHHELQPESLGGPLVNDLTQDPSGRLWIGTNQGLDYLAPNVERFQHVSGPLAGQYIKALLADQTGAVWLGTPGGLLRMDPQSHQIQTFKHDPKDPDTLSSNMVSHLAPGDGDTLWVGTVGGLNLLSTQTGKVIRFHNRPKDPTSISADNIKYIHRDTHDRIWVGTYNGLNLVDGQRFQRFGPDQGLSHQTVTCIADTGDTLWVGTMAGLNRLDPASGTMTSFREHDGLPHDIIAGIIHGPKGFLWISTGRGLARFDPSTQSFFRFNSADGLKAGAFAEGSAFRDRDGRLYFGGYHGLIRFDPADVTPPDPPPPVLLTDFLLFNRSIRPSDSGLDNVLPVALDHLDRLRLDYRDDLFALEFSLPDFHDPDHQRFAYRLEGFDKDWIETDARHRRATYTRLEPGTYQFQVKGRVGDGAWTATPTTLDIKIIPPFWKTHWFQAVVLLLLVVLGNLLYRGGRYLFLLVSHWKKTTHIGPYKLLKLLGKGGMGDVHQALDLVSKKVVALKVLLQEAPDETSRKRFIKEGLICERVDHPNIIKIYSRGEHNNRLYYAMEYCEGLTLRKVIKETGVSIAAAVHITNLMVDILHTIHQAGIIHRDIKPENIMLTGKMDLSKMVRDKGRDQLAQHLKVLDFGVSKFMEEETLTRTGEITGTMYYLPPEYLENPQNLSPHLDFYALGVMLYEMLTQRRPFTADSAGALFQVILSHNPVPPRFLNPRTPAALSDFTLSLLEKDVDQRLTQYEDIKARLERVTADSTDAMTQSGGPGPISEAPTKVVEFHNPSSGATAVNTAPTKPMNHATPVAKPSEPSGDTDWLADTPPEGF